MEKSIICDYWKNNICKYMNDSLKCKYAHGESEIKVVECMYGNHCYNINCKFNHGESTVPNTVYDIPIVNKRKLRNKNKRIINKEKNMKMEQINPQKTNTIINLVDYNKDDKNNISVKDEVQNIDPVVTINNKLKEENNKLKQEINKLKEEINEMKKKYTKKKVVDDKIVNNDRVDKIMIKYNKYIKIYELFINNNYKTINLEEIKKYTKDNNIYKLKQRSSKIYNYYEQFKKGIIDKLLPVSTIFKMVF